MKNEIVWEKILIPKFKYDDVNTLYDVTAIVERQYLEVEFVVDIIDAYMDIGSEMIPAMFAIEFAGEMDDVIDKLNEFVFSKLSNDTEISYLETITEDHEEYQAYYEKYHRRN